MPVIGVSNDGRLLIGVDPIKLAFMITIRIATEEDAELLPKIERSSGEAFRQIEHLAWIADDEVQSVERHLSLIRQGSSWVAHSATQGIAGFLSAERHGRSLHVWQMAVHADWQKQGIGRKLIGAAVRWSLAQDITALTLTTFRNVPWNEPFYRSCGFRVIETDVPVSLQNILDAEAAAGLPREQRCAMIYNRP